LISASHDCTIKIWDFGFHYPEIAENKLPFLLSPLGITTQEEYFDRLKCTPDFLPKIGVQSLADLKVLGVLNSALPELRHLIMVVEADTHDHRQPQTRAFAKKGAIYNILQTLLDGADQKINEIHQCSTPLYEKEHPWTRFQEQLVSYKATLQKQCQTPQSLLQSFSPESYGAIVASMNDLIETFHALDREHQIVRLCAYVGQGGILEEWNKFHKLGINSLAALLERADIAPRDLFQMRKQQ
jgi:hypothetical protein